jgi:rhodanese-related sulfurtransferase
MANEQVVTPDQPVVDAEAAARNADAFLVADVVSKAQAAIASRDITALSGASFATGAGGVTSREIAIIDGLVKAAITELQNVAPPVAAAAVAPVDGAPAVALATGNQAAAAGASSTVTETPAGAEVKTEAAAVGVSDPLAAVKPAGNTSPEAAALLASLGIKQDEKSAMAIGGVKSTAA